MQQRARSRALPHYERILYATNGSSTAQKAGRHAVFLAQRSQAQLIVLCAVPNSLTRRLSFLLRRSMTVDRKLASQAVEEIVKLADACGVSTLPAIEVGRWRDVIDRVAARYDVDLIVMSADGGEDLHQIFDPPSPGASPLWAKRPVCVILS